MPEESTRREHSLRGASSFYRVRNCPGSVNLILKYGLENEAAGEPAAQGSVAHYVAEQCLVEGREPWEFAGQVVAKDGFDITVDTEMVGHVQGYVSFVQSLLDAYPGSEMHVELPMDTLFDEEGYGTSDVVIVTPAGKLIVPDLKYGYVVVEPDSDQLKYYGALADERFPPGDVDEADLWVYQPRQPHPDGVARRYPTTRSALRTWFHETALPAMAASREPDAFLRVGDWCRFCPARKSCPAIRKETLDFPVSLPPDFVPSDELAALTDKLRALVKVLPSYEAEIFSRMSAGGEVPGWKLVRKKANRAWVEGAEKKLVRKFGKKNVYQEPALKSPAQVEKLDGGKKFVAEWAESPDLGLTAAPESDKRRAYTSPMDDSGPPAAGD